MKKILAVVCLCFAVIFIGVYFLAAPIGYQGSAYAAKNLCSGIFVSQFDGDTVVQQAIIPASPPLAYARYTIDNDNKNITASMLGLYKRTAQFRPSLGCTIVPRELDKLDSIDLPVFSVNQNATKLLPVISDGVDLTAIEKALDYAFAENDPRGNKNTKAVVVFRGGQLIAERYAEGVKPTSPLLGWSMSKSVTNMLVGILVKKGEIDINDPAPVSEWKNDNRATITTNNLLQMSSGLDFNETYGMATDVSQMLTTELNMGAFAASKSSVHPVGEFWSYSSGTSNIIARMIYQLVGGNLAESYQFTQSELFQPLGIQNAMFEPDASGIFVGSSYLHLPARDWAKLGQLMLQDGVWQGQKILPDGWIKYSTTPAPANNNNDYGAHFWLNADPDDSTKQRTWPDVPADVYSMNGYQGQYVVVIPSKDLVVVRLGFTPRPARAGMNKMLSQIVSAIH